jgi:predicted AAA+ superfamily ATPase
MAKLKPWFHVVTPRDDLREGKPLDASESAVNLEDILEGRARPVYREPAQFFERTYLTGSLKDLAAQAVRRLSGIEVETSPVFSMATQFGGGKMHALALLYHLAKAGPESHEWQGVQSVLDRARVQSVPAAATAIFGR